MNLAPPDRVHRLLLPGGGDALRRRRAAEQALATGLPAPTALPPGAWLVVRRVALAEGAAWGERLHRQIDGAWAAAERPRLARPSAAAQALWFADEAELLAFLAHQLQQGGEGWWWPALLPALRRGWSRQAAVVERWQAAAAAVPAALEQLGGAAQAVLGCFGEPACVALVQAVGRAFGVQRAAARGDGLFAGQGDRWGAGAAGAPVAFAAPGPPGATRAAMAGVPMAQAGASASAAGLRPRAAVEAAPAAPPPTSQQLLLQLAQALRQRPAEASYPGFFEAVFTRAQEAMAAGPGAAVVAPPLPAVVQSEVPAGIKPTASVSFVPPPATGRPAVVPRSTEPADEAAAFGPRLIATRCAGLWFLLPLMQRLGWYGDFSEPQRPSPHGHPAVLLRRVGEQVLRREFRADPLRPALRAWGGMAADRVDARAACAALQQAAAAALGRAPRGTLAWLLRRPGRVGFGPLRIDVWLPLATHPLAIRAAGLDRDPGWLPAAGRQIAFHFELDGVPR